MRKNFVNVPPLVALFYDVNKSVDAKFKNIKKSVARLSNCWDTLKTMVLWERRITIVMWWKHLL